MSEERNLITDKDIFRRLFAGQGQDIRRDICTKAEAMELLGLKDTEFYAEINRPESKAIPSKKRGKYILAL